MSLYTVRCQPLKMMYILLVNNRARQRFHTERLRGGGREKTVVTEPKA